MMKKVCKKITARIEHSQARLEPSEDSYTGIYLPSHFFIQKKIK